MRRIGILLADSSRAALALWLFCVIASVAHGGQTGWEKRIVSGGIIVVEKAELRSGPSDSTSVVKQLHFGDPFFVLGWLWDVEFGRRVRTRTPEWLEVLLTDKETRGWIISSVGHESHVWKDDFKEEGLPSLYYNVAVSLSASRQYDAAESLFAWVLRQPRGTRVTVSDSWGLHEVDGRDAALNRLAEMSQGMNDYDRAIELYEQLIVSGDTTMAAMACLNIARIYVEHKKDFEAAIRRSFQTVKHFQNVYVEPCDECPVDVDVTAAEVIRASLEAKSAGAEEYLECGEKMIKLSRNPATGILGYIILCQGHLKLGRYDRMAGAMSEGLKMWPVGLRAGFKEYSRDYSGDGVALVVSALLDSAKSPSQALRFCDDLISETSNDTLLHNLFLARGLTLDMGHAPKDATIEAYAEARLRPYPQVAQPPFSYVHYGRLKYLLAFAEYSTAVVLPEVAARSAPDSAASELFMLKKGDSVIVLCDAPAPYDSTWLKVQVGEDRYGWVRESSLSLERIHTRQLCPFDKDNNWWCPGANTAHTSSVGGSPITNPTVLWLLPGLRTWEVVYSDVDRDGICDVVLGGWEGCPMTALSGKDRRTIWCTDKSTPRRFFGAPSMSKNLLALASTRLVEVIAIGGGEPLWSLWVNRIIPTPVLAGDTVFFHGNYPRRDDDLGMRIFGLRLSDKEIILESSKEFLRESFPLTLDREARFIIATGEYQDRASIWVLSMDSGKELWKYDFQGRIATPAVVHGPFVLFVAQDRHTPTTGPSLIALDKTGGEPLLRVGLGPSNVRGVAVNHGIVVVACAKNLRAFDLKSGAPLWEFEPKEEFSTQPCMVDTVVYAAESGGYIYALNLYSGELLWEFNTEPNRWGRPASPLSSSSGMLSFVTDKGYLHVLGNRK